MNAYEPIPNHAQLMTHLKLAHVKLGLLINFGKKDLRTYPQS